MPTLTTLVDGTVPVAADFNGNFSALNAAIGSSTAITGYTVGDMVYGSATDTLSKLAIGSTGQVLSIAGGIPQWQGGGWTTPAFNAGDYTGSGSMTWTVASGDVSTFRYVIIGKTMTIAFFFFTTTVGGTPDTELKVTIPGGHSAKSGIVYSVPCRVADNGSTGFGLCQVQGDTALHFFNSPTGAANWAASVDNTFVQGEITFEID